MIALQKAVNPLFSSPMHRPSHARHPSAPVVRPTHTPGLLTLSKPAYSTSPRTQQAQPQNRSPRSAPKGKLPKSTPVPTTPSERKTPEPQSQKSTAPGLTPATDKPARGRLQKKASKDNTDSSHGIRSLSLSSARLPVRRLVHQPSPPPSKIPSQAEERRLTPLRAHTPPQRESNANLFDPFVVSSPEPTSASAASSPNKADIKPPTYRVPPLASRPTGKLARRRQLIGQVPTSPTATRAVPVPRRKTSDQRPNAHLSRSEPASFRGTSLVRPSAGRASSSVPVWEAFPVCDDSAERSDADITPPTTPIKETASKKGSTWQQTLTHPLTAPLSAPVGFPFGFETPSPAHRRRHQRVPSDGVFQMSTDDDSSDASEDTKTLSFPTLHRTRSALVQGAPKEIRSVEVPGAMPDGYFAGSAFQNSPSPDELPVPSFLA